MSSLGDESTIDEPSFLEGQLAKLVLEIVEATKDRDRTVNHPIHEKVVEKDAHQEKLEVKVEAEARYTDKLVKGKQIYEENPEFTQCPIDLASLSLVQVLKLVTFSQDKASEDLVKLFSKHSEFITLASSVSEKCMPSFQKDLSNTPLSQLKSIINFVDSHFQSFEKSDEEKVHNEFYARMLQTLKKIVADNKITLDIGIKCIKEALSKRGNIYKSCLMLSRFT